MYAFSRKGFLITLLIMLCMVSCASIKTVYVWKDEGYRQKLGKTLVIAVAQVDFMRDHFENVLAWRLNDRGIDAIPSNKVIPQLPSKLDREAIVAKVKELGVENVVIARVTSRDEYSRLIAGDEYHVPEGSYSSWDSFYADSFYTGAGPNAAYDAEFFTAVTNIYDVKSDKLIWSYLSRIRVETSRQAAINPFIEKLMKHLESSKLV